MWSCHVVVRSTKRMRAAEEDSQIAAQGPIPELAEKWKGRKGPYEFSSVEPSSAVVSLSVRSSQKRTEIMSDSDDEVADRQFKMVLLGDPQVGKTSMVTRYAKEMFTKQGTNSNETFISPRRFRKKNHFSALDQI